MASEPATGFDAAAAAREAADAIYSGRQIAPFSSRAAPPNLSDAYQAAAELRRIRGAKLVGRKIGFTNRRLWPTYGVSAPIWGDVTAETLIDLSDEDADADEDLRLAGLCEPKIEPEVVFGLGAAPAPDMDDDDLADCIDWAAPGFEIVQSIYPQWRFAAADTIIAGGLHGRLLLGAVTPASRIDFSRLPELRARLFRDEREVDTGRGADVLDSPLSALRHLVELLALDPHNPPLAADELVSTGTLTEAWPIAAGETWRASFEGAALAEISIRFV